MTVFVIRFFFSYFLFLFNVEFTEDEWLEAKVTSRYSSFSNIVWHAELKSSVSADCALPYQMKVYFVWSLNLTLSQYVMPVSEKLCCTNGVTTNLPTVSSGCTRLQVLPIQACLLSRWMRFQVLRSRIGSQGGGGGRGGGGEGLVCRILNPKIIELVVFSVQAYSHFVVRPNPLTPKWSGF